MSGCPMAKWAQGATPETCPQVFDTPLPDYQQRLEALHPKLERMREVDPQGCVEMAKHLAGPLAEDSSRAARLALLKEGWEAAAKGSEHELWDKLHERYGGAQGKAANLLIPQVLKTRTDDTSREWERAVVVNQVVLCHPDDCLRIAAKHVRKQPNFLPGFMSSIISTTHNKLWEQERKTLTQAFLPHKALREIFPASKARAVAAAEKMRWQLRSGSAVNMNDFFLHEAKAQLRLALWGENEETMESVNSEYRAAMDGRSKDPLKDTARLNKQIMARVRSGENAGPLSRALRILDSDLAEKNPTGFKNVADMTLAGNTTIFSFAGYDTTGHTMTWLMFELAKQPHLQERLRAEVDALWEKVKGEGRDVCYEDFQHLPFMTRCIMETLRLWPAVPNGTFRQLEEDDWVTGRNGEKVWLKEGTFVQIATWPRHRNKALWGEDADRFNPDREFAPSELWDGKAFSAKNPHTERFSPFTHPPRDCIGKNFAQMEIRLIYLHLLRDFRFELCRETGSRPAAQQGLNYGTMGPRDANMESMVARKANGPFPGRFALGLKLRVVPRNLASKL